MAQRLKLEALETREVPAAKLQLIHNSPYAETRTVDVYINNNLLLNDLNYQTATAFLDLASGTNLEVDITPSNSTTPLATFMLNLADGSTSAAVIVGGPGSLKLPMVAARSAALGGNVDVLAFNASPDAGMVDLRLRSAEVGPTTIGNDLALGAYGSGYVSTAPNNNKFTVVESRGGIPHVTGINLAAYAGKAAIVMASGFAHPANASDPKLATVAVFSDGTSVLLGQQPEAAYAVGSATSKGGTIILSSANGITTNAVIAFPGATSSARVASADLTGDGVPDVIAASGPGMIGLVRILNGVTGELIREIEPFGNFTGGVNVSAGDINGDGVPDYVISPDDGGGPRVRVFNGKTHAQIADYFGIDDVTFRGGARAAIADLNHDGKGDVMVSAGLGGGPRIALFNGALLGANGGPKFGGDFFAFEPELRNGAFVTAGDINGDGFADLIVGGGPGGGPRVRAFDGRDLTLNKSQTVLADFFAGNTDERMGARVSAKDVDGDGKADIIAGGVPHGAAVTRTFLAIDLKTSGMGTSAADTTSFNGSDPLGEVFVG